MDRPAATANFSGSNNPRTPMPLRRRSDAMLAEIPDTDLLEIDQMLHAAASLAFSPSCTTGPPGYRLRRALQTGAPLGRRRGMAARMRIAFRVKARRIILVIAVPRR